MKLFDNVKNYISMVKLAALLMLAPAAIYVLSVSDTVKLYNEYRQAKESSEAVTAADKGEEFSASAPMLSSGVLMRMKSDVCAVNKVSVGHFSPEEIEREGTLRLVSAQLDLTGGFIGLLKVLASIESVQDIKIRSAEFRTVKVGKNSRTVQLALTVLQVEEHRL